MPSVAHLIFGGIFGLFLYFLTNKRFTKTHVFILFMNNYLGPDVGWALLIGEFTHSILGMSVFAFILAIFYSYFSRFTPDFKNKVLIDHGYNRVPYMNTYLLVLAGGIMHLYLDGIMNYVGNFGILPELGSYEGFWISIQDLNELWRFSAIGIDTMLSVGVGVVFIIVLIYGFPYLLKQNENKIIPFIIIFIIPFMVCFYLLGNMILAYHPDAGAIIYVILYHLLPLGFMVLSVKSSEKPIQERKTHNKDGMTRLRENSSQIIMKIYAVVGLIFIGGGCIAIILKNYLIEVISNFSAFWGTYATELTIFIILAGILLVGFGIFNVYIGFKMKTAFTDFKLLMIITWLFVTSFLGSILLIGGFTITEPCVIYIYDIFGARLSPYISESQLISIVPYATTILGILGLFNMVLGIGLVLKNEKIWRVCIMYNGILMITLVGLVICCYLNENKIKKIFQSQPPDNLGGNRPS